MKILPIDNGMTGTIVVDGKNFPLNEHVFYLGKDTSWIAPAWFNSWLIEASSTQLKFGYQCNQIGETPIYLKIDQQYFRFDTPLKVEGAHLAKLIPPSPRVGEEVEVVIEDAITDEQYGLYSSMNDSHYSLYAKNKIIFPLIAEQTNLTLFYGNGLNRLYSNTLPITFSFPWKPIGSLPYSYQEIYIEDKWGYICNSQTLHRFSLTGGDQKSWKIAYPDSVDWGKFNPQSKCTDIYATEDDVYISVNAPVKTQSGKNKVEFFLLRFRQIEERWEILTHFPAPSYAKIAQCGRNLLVNIDHRDLFVYHLDNNTSQLHYNKLTDRVYLGNTDKGYFYFLRRHAVNYWQCYRINADGSGEAQAIGSLVPYLLNDIQNLKIANGFLYISDPMARLSLNEKDAKWEYLGTPRNLYADLFQIWPTSDAIYSTVSNSILLYRFEDDRK